MKKTLIILVLFFNVDAFAIDLLCENQRIIQTSNDDPYHRKELEKERHFSISINLENNLFTYKGRDWIIDEVDNDKIIIHETQEKVNYSFILDRYTGELYRMWEFQNWETYPLEYKSYYFHHSAYDKCKKADKLF